MRRITAILTILLLATPGLADPPVPGDTTARYDVRLLGIKVGEMTLAGRIGGGAYAVASKFSTGGIAGALARAGFDLKSRGRVNGKGFMPDSYDERIDTGSRRSTAQLRYRGGVPRITGGTLASAEADSGETPLDPAREGGTLDPLTAMFAALHDRTSANLCTTNVTIFDGARRSAIRTTGRQDAGDEVICTGSYVRLAGFSASELKRQTVYPFSIRFAPAPDGRMQARQLIMRSSYGKAELLRR